ncbi:MAG TPA: ABC transporter substrate-binding protein [Caulobacteraceae bacterium]|jgi:sulfonate transport system substrate-binding protein
MPRLAENGAVRNSGRQWAVLAAAVAASVGLLFAFAPNRRAAQADAAVLAEPLPDKVPPGVTLIVGDPVTRWVFEHNGWDKRLPFTLHWAEITGGPDTTEAFHARALDVGFGADVPPIHAVWVGLPVKIVAVREKRHWRRYPSWVFGVSPKAHIASLEDLKGKRIAFSPSQVQSQVVLQTLIAEGLTPQDVTLVELPSSIGGDVYTNALASGVVDVAPLGAGIVAEKYVRKFGRDGAQLLPHPEFRDDTAFVYTPVEVLKDPGKAAALKVFVRWWARAQAWEQAHPDELAAGYYVGKRGLSPADAKIVMDAGIADIDTPADWSAAVVREQTAIDLLAPRMNHPRFDAKTLFDRRFEAVASSPSESRPS